MKAAKTRKTRTVPADESPEITAKEFARMKPAREVLPGSFFTDIQKLRRGRGPGKKPKKAVVTLRLDPDVVAAFKAEGQGWQGRINETLRKAKKLPASKERA